MWKKGLMGLCLLAAAAGAFADEAGQALDQVSFQVAVERELDNDQVDAVLSVIAEDKQPDALAETINQSMRWALDLAKQESAVKVRSGGYQTSPVYDERKIVRWRGQQELMLQSGDVDRISRLVGKLQEKLEVQSLQFSVSNATRRAAESDMINDVLARFKERAALVAHGLDAKGYSIVSLSINTADQGYVPPIRVQAMRATASASAPPPALEAGTSKVSVQAAGTIMLRR